MARVLFGATQQKTWIDNIFQKSGYTAAKLATICGVSPRTFRDWRKEKFSISSEAALILRNQFGSSLPPGVQKVSNYWYVAKGSRKGALKRLELYGPPGTAEGRRKGGQISQLRRRLYPELYKNCNLAKIWKKPQKSELLAELVGIILGDGAISDNQLKISLNRDLERNYLRFVSNLIHKLFGEKPRKHNRSTPKRVIDLCISGVNLVKLLQKMGLKKGNKVAHQVGVPSWICKRNKYAISCLRGLVDTDGCVFLHDHLVHNVRCLNLGVCFSSHSQPLLGFVYGTLKRLGYGAKRRDYNVFLYKEAMVLKYASEIGFSNNHHTKRLGKFLKRKYSMVRCESPV